MEIPDLSVATYYERRPARAPYVSVGWLGAAVPTHGRLSRELVSKLRIVHEECQLLCGELGKHTCELCGRFEEGGEFFLADGETRYVFPNMVLHYIEAHDYRPPEAVVSALVAWRPETWQAHVVSPHVDRFLRDSYQFELQSNDGAVL